MNAKETPFILRFLEELPAAEMPENVYNKETQMLEFAEPCSEILATQKSTQYTTQNGSNTAVDTDDK